NVGREEGHDEEEEEDELYRDVNINLGRGMESIFETTSQMDVQTLISVAPLLVFAPTLTPSTIATIRTLSALTPPTTAPSTLLQDLPNFSLLFRFDHRLKTLEANFSEFMQTNQFAGAVSSIPKIVQRYMDQRMNETVKIIKEQVKQQVKVQVSKILSKIEYTVNKQLEAEVLTRSSNSSKTSYDVAADLSEIDLKKILIEKIEGNKSIHRSNEQRNLYKALRRRDDDVDKDKEPSAGSDRGSKRRREGKEPESASAPKEKATRITSKSTQGSKSLQTSASESAIAEEPMQTTFEMEEPLHLEFKIGADDQPIVEPYQHPEWFSQQKNHQLRIVIEIRLCQLSMLKVDTLTPELLAGPTYELIKGSCKSIVELEFFLEEVYKATTDQLDWVNPKFYGFAVNRESSRDVYSKRRIIVVTKLKIVEWHNYKHLDWITVRRDDEKLYKFKERKEAYIAYSNLRGFIYQNKDKQNRLMQIDELHKFSDGTLTDIRTALDNRLKGIRMKYLPQTIWRKSDKERAAAMIHAIDKRLQIRRIMRSLERFVGGRLYEGDFRMLQRTI
nr:hypothetical protein [Tanacetum cinerariifolium]